MGHEGVAAGKALLRVSKAGNGCQGQLVLAHISERSFVDHIVVAPGPKQLKKIQPALRTRGCKKGEAVIADMSAKAVLGLMPGARIVNGKPGSRSKPFAQHLDVFLEESVLLAAQQPHDLPLGDIDAQTGKLRGQARDSDLPLVVLAQNEALEVRPEMAGDALWQSGHNRPPDGSSQRSRR